MLIENNIIIIILSLQCPNPPVLKFLARVIWEKVLLCIRGIVSVRNILVILSPAQSVQLLINIAMQSVFSYLSYMTNCHYNNIILCTCFAGQLSMQWQCKQAVVLKTVHNSVYRYVIEAYNYFGGSHYWLGHTLHIVPSITSNSFPQFGVENYVAIYGTSNRYQY